MDPDKTSILYLVDFRWSMPNLTEVVVERETDKTFVVVSYTHLLNSVDSLWPNKRVRKQGCTFFRTKIGAIHWLVDQAALKRRAAEKALETLARRETELRKLYDLTLKTQSERGG